MSQARLKQSVFNKDVYNKLPVHHESNNAEENVNEKAAPAVYVVKEGDTVAGIALRHHMRESDLRQLNHIFGGTIFQGQELKLRNQLRSRSNSLPYYCSNQTIAKTDMASNSMSMFNRRNSISISGLIDIARTFRKLASLPEKCTHIQPEQVDIPVMSTLQEVAHIPQLLGSISDSILSRSSFNKYVIPKLESNLPIHYRGYDWKLVYSLLQHGACLDTFYLKTKSKHTTLIIIETCDGDIFGGFNCTPWNVCHSYYGTGESFVFTSFPQFECFKWKSNNSMIMFSAEHTIAMGGGGGFAWVLNSDLSRGSSNYSATFENRCLCRHDDFDISNVEVWEFVNS